MSAATIAPAIVALRCATPDCGGRHVCTIRAQAAGSTEWVTVDLCFYCRGILLDRGGRYVVQRRAA
jgi:Zn-finger nucleic acid-binding protein